MSHGSRVKSVRACRKASQRWFERGGVPPGHPDHPAVGLPSLVSTCVIIWGCSGLPSNQNNIRPDNQTTKRPKDHPNKQSSIQPTGQQNIRQPINKQINQTGRSHVLTRFPYASPSHLGESTLCTPKPAGEKRYLDPREGLCLRHPTTPSLAMLLQPRGCLGERHPNNSPSPPPPNIQADTGFPRRHLAPAPTGCAARVAWSSVHRGVHEVPPVAARHALGPPHVQVAGLALEATDGGVQGGRLPGGGGGGTSRLRGGG